MTDELMEIVLKSPAFEVTQFALFSSQMSPKGSRYRVESAYPLGD